MGLLCFLCKQTLNDDEGEYQGQMPALLLWTGLDWVPPLLRLLDRFCQQDR